MALPRIPLALLASALLIAQDAPKASAPASKAAPSKPAKSVKPSQPPIPKKPLIPNQPELAPNQARGLGRKKTPKLPYDQRTNLNTASKEELMKLPGVSEETVAKIIAGRPYMSKADLVVKGAVSGALYFTLKDKVAAGPLPGQSAPDTK